LWEWWLVVRRFERELDEELGFHLEMETRKNVELGMSLEEAHTTARARIERRCYPRPYSEERRRARVFGMLAIM
jgi:hypothetical protein